MVTMTSKKIRTLIADDEPLARQTIRSLLQGDPKIEIVGEARNGSETLDSITRLQPDLLFLDIRMPALNGFEVLEAARDLAPAVVFVTAYDQYAVEAFRAEALDYLLKPFEDSRFYQVLSRVKSHLETIEWSAVGRRLSSLMDQGMGPRSTGASVAGPPPLPAGGNPPLERIVIRSGNRIAVVRSREVDWIESADNYVVLHVGPKTHLIRQTMQELIAGLDPMRFLRVHRSAAVNLDRVRELRVESHGEAIAHLDTGAQVKVSRYRRQTLEDALSRRCITL
jgi:two-component system, LytTR family, response regulator